MPYKLLQDNEFIARVLKVVFTSHGRVRTLADMFLCIIQMELIRFVLSTNCFHVIKLNDLSAFCSSIHLIYINAVI